jgi:hypothetical protein
MNLTQLRKEAKVWQKKLGLTHWKITVVWAKPDELNTETEKVFGLNAYDPNHMESTIKILNPKYENYNVLNTLVHELLHLYMFPLESAAGFSIKPPTDQWETAMEQTINRLSELLMENHNGRNDRREDQDRKGRGSNQVPGDGSDVP